MVISELGHACLRTSAADSGVMSHCVPPSNSNPTMNSRIVTDRGTELNPTRSATSPRDSYQTHALGILQHANSTSVD